MGKWTAEQIEDQTGKVVVVTGANTGIGYITAQELARKGATVVVACRSEERGRDAVARMEIEGIAGEALFRQLDLASLESVRSFAAELRARFDRLDLLINNAGVMIPPRSETKEGFELQIGVNHLGHFALTALLIDLLLATPDSRIVTVASLAHRRGVIDFEDLNSRNKPYDRMQTYAQSKLANLLFTRELQRRLARAGASTIAVAAHPGWTATDLQRHSGLIRFLNLFLAQKPWQGALPTLFAAVEPGVLGGEYFGPKGWWEFRGYPGRVNTVPAARDDEAASRLWTTSADLVGIDFAGLRYAE